MRLRVCVCVCVPRRCGCDGISMEFGICARLMYAIHEYMRWWLCWGTAATPCQCSLSLFLSASGIGTRAGERVVGRV